MITILIWGLIFSIAYILEKHILPNIAALLIKDFKYNDIRKGHITAYKNMKRLRGVNVWEKISEYSHDNPHVRNEILSGLFLIPITLILFLICINNIFSYALIVPIVIITLYIFKVMVTILNKHDIH